MEKKQNKKSRIKRFCEDYGYEIGMFGASALILLSGGLWIHHVKKNTFELTKPSITNGKVYDHYRQFGKTYLNAESDLGAMSSFVDSLIGEGLFKSADRVLFMVTDDKDI